MKPIRNFQFRNKKEIFACVGFRYDNPTSLDYRQFKEAKSVALMVDRLLSMADGADIISIRRVYLPQDEPAPTDDIKELVQEAFKA